MTDTSPFPIAPPPHDGGNRRVDPGNCFDWLRQGWALFTGNPGIWIGATVIVAVLTMALHIVPVIGSLVANLLTPVLAAGMLDMARRQSAGTTLEINDLFVGFKEMTGPLIVLGVIYTVALAVVVIVVALLVTGGIAGGAAGMAMGGGRPAGVGMGLGMMFGSVLLAGLLGAVLAAPLMMAMWFAPALVFFNRMEPVAALKASFHACTANWLVLLVYGVILLVLAFFAALPMGLGFLVLAPVVTGSIYASYRDIFPRA